MTTKRHLRAHGRRAIQSARDARKRTGRKMRLFSRPWSRLFARLDRLPPDMTIDELLRAVKEPRR